MELLMPIIVLVLVFAPVLVLVGIVERLKPRTELITVRKPVPHVIEVISPKKEAK